MSGGIDAVVVGGRAQERLLAQGRASEVAKHYD